MKDRYLHFIGFLSNTDGSISKLSLEKDFSFDVIPYEEAQQLLFEIKSPLSKYDIHKLKFGGTNLQIVKKSIPLSESSDDTVFNAFNQLGPEIENNVIRPIRAIRLYKENALYLPIYYCFVQNGDSYKPLIRFEDHNLYHQARKLILLDNEIESLQQFIEKFRLPFDKPYIQLSFDMFEMSYKGTYPTIGLICLISGLESLFNTGGPEITKTISRHIAVLLAKDKVDGDIIYKDLKRLYNIRSSIVHARKLVSVSERDLFKLRNYLRESIKRISSLALEKADLFDLLNKHGFGDLSI